MLLKTDTLIITLTLFPTQEQTLQFIRLEMTGVYGQSLKTCRLYIEGKKRKNIASEELKSDDICGSGSVLVIKTKIVEHLDSTVSGDGLNFTSW